jgi:P-type Cu+ transporter
MAEYFFTLSRLSCSSCVVRIQHAVKKVPGVDAVTVQFSDQTMFVSGNMPVASVMQAVKQGGYTIKLSKPPIHLQKKQLTLVDWLPVFFGLGVLFLIIMLMQQGFMQVAFMKKHIGFSFHMVLLVLGSMIGLGYNTMKQTFIGLRYGIVTMDTLITMGVIAAWAFSVLQIVIPFPVQLGFQQVYLETPLLILIFVHVGHLIHRAAQIQSGDALNNVLSLRDRKVDVMIDNKVNSQNLATLRIGDCIRLHAGNKVAVDCTLEQGRLLVDRSAMTGEIKPTYMEDGDQLIAGFVIVEGTAMAVVTGLAKESQLQKMIDYVQKSLAKQPQIVSWADTIVRIFVPLVIFLAVVAALVWYIAGPQPQWAFAIIVPMTMLLIACPCAIGLAIPLAWARALGHASKMNVLMRHGDAFEQLAHAKTIIFDKTGTLTKGQFSLISYQSRDFDTKTMIQWIVSAEQHCDHPIGKALVSYGVDHQIALVPVTAIKIYSGLGLACKIDGKDVVIGQQKLLKQESIKLIKISENKLAPQHASVVHVAVEGKHIGTLYLGDQLRDESKKLVLAFKKHGFKTVMLTGDHHESAQFVAQSLSLDNCFADLMPADKANIINKLQQQSKHKVVMVGDGVNDALALTQADVGIALATGSNLALNAGSINIMCDDLMRCDEIYRLSLKALKVMRQNIGLAMLYNVCALPFAAGILYPWTGWLLSPVVASIAMVGSSISVVLRSGFFRWQVKNQDTQN